MNSKIDQLAQLKIDRQEEIPGNSRWLLVLAGVAVVLAVAGLAWRYLANPAVEVTVQTVRLSQATDASNSVLDASGYVVARRQATVSSKISGRVTQVLIEEGNIVEADQVVAYLDDSQQRAYLALARAELVSAQARLKETQAQLAQAEQDLVRIEELARRNLTSAADLDAARANAQVLRARLEAGREAVTVARRSLDVSQDQLSNTVIRAPFAGVVVSKNAQPGEMISPNSAGGGFTRTGICTIVDMDSLEIEVDVNEAYIQRVRQGQPVTATLDAYQDWKIPAEVIAIVPTADRQKATVKVRIGFVEKDERVLRDMGVKVAFLDDPKSDKTDAPIVAAYIEQGALNTDSDGNFVWVVRDESVIRRPVTVGQRSSRGVQIMGGLSAGDRVVVSSDKPLTQGHKVTVVNL